MRRSPSGGRLLGVRARVATIATVGALSVLGMAATAGTAQAAPAGTTHHATGTHAYPGTIWMRGHNKVEAACSSKCVKYQGGIDGVGVTDGKEKVYIIFWGSQWGSESTNSHGYATFSGDPDGLAPDIQGFFAGLGSSSDKWSGVMTTYCQGVATGATTCPSSAPHVGYPTGGALAGVWEDNGASEPNQVTGHQLAEEAEKAATHFGLTTTAENRYVQYDIISAHGTNPDNYEGQGFCAWHDYTQDSTLDGGGGASGPIIAFTNMPYVPDAGAGCGAGFVNPGNDLDGVTIVNGHEYAETVTDQFPAGGWIDNAGEEVGDLCAWKSSGTGRSQDITLSTGTFAVQGIWENVANSGKGGCSVSHSIVT